MYNKDIVRKRVDNTRFYIYMSKIKIKYNQITYNISVRTDNALSLGKEKIKNLSDIEKDTLKNTLFVLCLMFVAGFMLVALGTFRNIDKKVSGIIIPKYSNVDEELVKRVKNLTGGYPIENMADYIAVEDDKVAAFLIAIAKKESNWGERTPKLNGEECYNYWGFREKRDRMGSGGHTCFDSPKDAVYSVANRIDRLVEKDFDTPEEMILWKCGYSCEGHNEESVQKWIDDVDFYYNKF